MKHVRLLPPLNIYTKNEWAVIIGPIIVGGMIWALHFIIEFSIILRLNLPLWLASFHMVGVALGGFIGAALRKKLTSVSGFLILNSFFSAFLCLLYLIQQDWSVPVALLGAGCSLSAQWGFMQHRTAIAVKDQRYTGRTIAVAYILIAFYVMFVAFLDKAFASNQWGMPLFIFGSYLLISFCTIKSTRAIKLVPQQTVRFREYLHDKANIPKIAMAFFFGLFFVNTYYSMIIIMQREDLMVQLNSFIITIMVSFGLTCIFAGLLIDTIGRRLALLLGFNIQALAFLLTSFLAGVDFVLLVVFPAVLGAGFAFIVLCAFAFFLELPKPEHVRDVNFIFISFMGSGCVFGIVLGEALKPLLLDDKGYMTIALLFIFAVATLSVSQLKETLPSKEELEWKSAVQYLYVISPAGLTLYQQDLRELPGASGVSKDGTLLGGALVAISQILKEVAENANPLKVVRQEGFSILLEESKNAIIAVVTTTELKSIRQKMIILLQEFEAFFGEVIEKSTGCDMNVFLPTKTLVSKIFC